MYTLDQLQNHFKVTDAELLGALSVLGLDSQDSWTDEDIDAIGRQIQSSRQSAHQASAQQRQPYPQSSDLPSGFSDGTLSGAEDLGTMIAAGLATTAVKKAMNVFPQVLAMTFKGETHPDPKVAAIQEEGFESIRNANQQMRDVFFDFFPGSRYEIPSLPAPATRALPGQQ